MLKKSFWAIIFIFVFHILTFGQSERVINFEVVNKKAISLPKPQIANLNHPKHFRIKEEQIVVVKVLIDLNGNVTNATAIFGHALLRQTCEKVARQAKFPPTYINTSEPFKINALLVYKFMPDGRIETDIDSNDKALIGKAVKFVEPSYTHCSCRFGVSVGMTTRVMVQVDVDEEGNVVKANAISGHLVLRAKVEQAARFSKFLPINRKTRFIISYNFAETDKWSARFKNAEIRNAEFLK